MTNGNALRRRIDESGMTVTAVASKANMLRETLYNRMRTGDFKVSEVLALTAVLNLSDKERDEIFFANNGE